MVGAVAAGNIDQAQGAVVLAAPPLRRQLEHREAAFPPASEDAEPAAGASVFPLDVDELEAGADGSTGSNPVRTLSSMDANGDPHLRPSSPLIRTSTRRPGGTDELRSPARS